MFYFIPQSEGLHREELPRFRGCKRQHPHDGAASPRVEETSGQRGLPGGLHPQREPVLAPGPRTHWCVAVFFSTSPFALDKTTKTFCYIIVLGGHSPSQFSFDLGPPGQFSRELQVQVHDVRDGADPLKKEATMEVKGNRLHVTR